MSQARTIVGSTEWCGFPTLGMPHILARVDSGAKTSGTRMSANGR